MKEKNIELLAPAGNMESFKAAINAGADAIYMGIDKYNARQMAKNFDMEKYIECIKYAHILNVKVYLTLNTLLYDNEMKEALEIVTKLYSAGLDGIIIQDIGLATKIHKIIPELPLHASTQMTIYNLEQVKFLEKIGFKRVVLARELTLDEIEYICKNTNLDIEVFVHGALCVCYSGQCLLSQVIGGRSANRGSCAQPCRMKYTLYSKDKKIVENRYLLSKKDIFGLDYLNKLYNLGVKSLKIEGRNKNPEYVAGVTKTYREYLDKIEHKKTFDVDKKDEKYILQIFNRDGKSPGYLDGVRYKESITENLPKNTGLYLGKVISQKKQFIKIKLEEDIDLHDGIEILDGNNVVFSNIVTCIKGENKNIVNSSVKKGSIVLLGDIKNKVKEGLKVFKTSDYKINNDLKKYYDGTVIKRRSVDVCVNILKDKKICVSTLNLANNISVSINYIPEIASNKEVNIEVVKESFAKTLDTLFEINITKYNIDKNLFVPKSKLNELRRELILNIENLFSSNIEVKDKLSQLDRIDDNINLIGKKDSLKKNILHVYRYNDKFNYTKYYNEKYGIDLGTIYIDITDMYKYKDKILDKYKDKLDVYVLLPNVGGKRTDDYICKEAENLIKSGVKGFIVGNIGYINILVKLKEKYNITLIADYTLNIFNKYSMDFYYSLGFDIICPSLELTEEQIEKYCELNIEVVTDYQTVMTSRYCILGAYVANKKVNSNCTMPCIKDRYYLIDNHNEKYDIVCNNLDCIMRIVAKRNRFKNTNYSVRHVII